MTMTGVLVLALALGLLLLAVLAARELLGKMGRKRGPSVPGALAVQGKRYFFARSERAFYGLLLDALPAGFEVFPNVRLNDIFLITARGPERQGVYNRLRDKHVDFLVVQLPDYRPVLGIELDGESHQQAEQQYRDAVKDVVFQSGGVRLLRFSTKDPQTARTLAQALAPHLR